MPGNQELRAQGFGPPRLFRAVYRDAQGVFAREFLACQAEGHMQIAVPRHGMRMRDQRHALCPADTRGLA